LRRILSHGLADHCFSEIQADHERRGETGLNRSRGPAGSRPKVESPSGRSNLFEGGLERG
jgi:hypothetical protein